LSFFTFRRPIGATSLPSLAPSTKGGEMKRIALVLALLAAALAVSALAAPGSGNADQGGNLYSIGLWGDVPYSDAQQTVGVPNLIADMNRSHVAFSVHNGDLKQGSGSLLRRRALHALGGLLQLAALTRDVHAW
jgi:hypothetical protein